MHFEGAFLPGQAFVGDELYKLIDGAAPRFFDNGFEWAVVRSWECAGSGRLSAEVYRVQTPAGAKALFGDGGGAHSLALAMCMPACDAQAPSSVQTGAPAAFRSSVVPSPACTGPVTYDWDFGDGSPHGTEQNLLHTYTEPVDT